MTTETEPLDILSDEDRLFCRLWAESPEDPLGAFLRAYQDASLIPARFVNCVLQSIARRDEIGLELHVQRRFLEEARNRAAAEKMMPAWQRIDDEMPAIDTAEKPGKPH